MLFDEVRPERLDFFLLRRELDELLQCGDRRDALTREVAAFVAPLQRLEGLDQLLFALLGGQLDNDNFVCENVGVAVSRLRADRDRFGLALLRNENGLIFGELDRVPSQRNKTMVAVQGEFGHLNFLR